MAIQLKGCAWPACDDETVFEWSFSLHPCQNGTWKNNKAALSSLFEFFKKRIVMYLTTCDFDLFRKEALEAGISLQEIERIPYLLPQACS